jgi:hypothetical protein
VIILAGNKGATGIVTKENFGSHTGKTCNRFTTKTAIWDRDVSVGIATRYGLDGPGMESRWGAKFSAPVQTGPGTHPASYTMGTGSFQGVKRPQRGVDNHPNLAPTLKEEQSNTSTPPLGLLGLFQSELWIVTHNTESAAVRNLKPQRLGITVGSREEAGRKDV